MNPRFPVKEEFPGGSSSSTWEEEAVEYGVAPPPPRPMEGLHEVGPPPFLMKTFDMVDDLTTAHILSWSRGGHSFVIWDPIAFSSIVLPAYFKHNNFSSFIRQLNTYGFRKIDADKWEFANEAFLRGQKHLLRNIKRKKAPSQSLLPSQAPIGPCVELGRFGQEAEIDRLRRDKQVLMIELVKLRQQQQNTRLHLEQMESRLQETEKKQQQMMRFLAKAMQNPDFIYQVVQLKAKNKKELEDAVSKKRRRPIEAEETSRRDQGLIPIKIEPLGFGEEYGVQLSELEALALEMQGLGKAKRERDEENREPEQLGHSDKELDEGFWEELLNQGFDEAGKMGKNEEEGVNMLIDRLGFLGSSSK